MNFLRILARAGLIIFMIPLALQFLFAILRLVSAMKQPAETISYVLGQVAGSAMIFALFAVAFQKLGRKPQPPAP